MTTANRVLNNIFSNWANLFVNLVISFFLAPFVVHSLGNTYYGIWVVMMQFTGYLYLLDLGVRESIIRYVSKYRAIGESIKLNDTLSAGLVFYSGIGFVAVLFSLVLAGTFSFIFNVPDDAVATARIVVILAGITIGQTLAFNIFTGILMGMQRYENIVELPTERTFLDAVGDAGWPLIAFEKDHAKRGLWEAEIPDDAVLVFGNEDEGCSPGILEAADQVVAIPMFGINHSYPISVAAGIAMAEWARRYYEKGRCL